MQKVINFKTKGMQRDLAVSAFNSEYSYENKNIRIIDNSSNSLYSLNNEKGTKLAPINNIINYLKGTVIGQATIEDDLVLFTTHKDSGLDGIYKINLEGDTLHGKLLYEGDLNFNAKYPIETLVFYENEDIKKVYWTDGLNQPRVINIAAAESTISKWENTSFDFVRTLKLNEEVTITRNTVSGGTFSPGTIQYVFTYYDKYGQESNIFYTSPLYYTSYHDRGASPESKVNNSFNIQINNLDTRFDYVRIYSILRTSIDATPEVRRVIDLSPTSSYIEKEIDEYKSICSINKIVLILRDAGEIENTLNNYTPIREEGGVKYWNFNVVKYSGIKINDITVNWDNNEDDNYSIISVGNDTNLTVTMYNNESMTLKYNTASIEYTDNGTSGDSEDPTALLYVGGEEVIFGTMAQKDNVLFLGDITEKRKVLDSTVREYFKGNDITFKTTSKSITPPDPQGYYSYDSQLKLNSYQFKTFKYLETYRFGIQAQHYTGRWSEPIWINDVRNTVHIETVFYNNSTIALPVASFTLDNSDIINRLINNGYVKVRPVVVYPTLSDREVICQGVLCPTVYNVGDRYGNAPFAQSSWFVRPNAPFDLSYVEECRKYSDASWGADWFLLGTNDRTMASQNSRKGILYSGKRIVAVSPSAPASTIDTVNKGAWAEFRHNHPIPDAGYRNAEIQCLCDPPTYPEVSSAYTDSERANWVSENSEYYYIDQSIVTLHSPDIEFDNTIKNLDTTGLKLRIVGMVPVTAFVGDIDIQTSTPANTILGTTTVAPGFYKEPIGANNNFTIASAGASSVSYGEAHFGGRSLLSGAFWLDEATDTKESAYASGSPWGFIVYPWHRNGSLNNTKYATDGYKSAMLDKKKMSNMRFSYKTVYYDTNKIWNAYEKDSDTRTGISGVSIFDSDEVSLIKIPAQLNSNNKNDITYYGNVDKLLTMSMTSDKKNGYPIYCTTVGAESSEEKILDYHGIFAYTNITGKDYNVQNHYSNTLWGVDPVRIKYKSTPHAVLALNYTKDSKVRVLPTLRDIITWHDTDNMEIPINDVSARTSSNVAFWNNKVSTVPFQDNFMSPIEGPIDTVKSPQYGWLWLGELYNDNVQNRFNGQTEEAFENNVWLPCGDAVTLTDSFNNPKTSVNIVWKEGDTYYQRYDHIKTYPYTLEDQNAMTDIISFMCETRVNLDGRYDRNRGQISNLAITPKNFNLLNDVYSQNNNFFTYRSINPNKLNLDNFHNTITWTKTKTAGELVDTWTNITLASTLDLDGDKGKVRALKRINNNIIAIQDKSISQILYNENTQLTTTEGVPVEIANSGKVSGKRYLSDKIGCTNKWSICETSNGIYFIDDITKGIYLFNGELNNISDKLGFHTWIGSASKNISIWNPVDFNGFVTYYDKTNDEVMFISKDECLGYSELLGQFTSFYSYENTPYFINLQDKGLWVKEGKLWFHNQGDYNMFFGEYKPFYTIVIANPDMTDKIFNTLEFRADSWDDNGNLLNTTFDTLETWNEYQFGEATLVDTKGIPSNLKRKFRIWRANIPRDRSTRDRMRNPWLYVKLSRNTKNTNKTILHDMIVHYFE